MFDHFKKRYYKICYTNNEGVQTANRTTRRSEALELVRRFKAAGCTDVVLWQRPRFI